MIKIAVCFKISDDLDELTPADWKAGATGGRPETGFVRRILGCFDEAALENSILLKEQINSKGEEVFLKAVTLNPGYSDHVIDRLKATGIDEIVCIESETETEFDPEKTAYILNENIDGDTDVIFCGAQCSPGNSGAVPVWLSTFWERAFFNAVTKTEFENGKIYATCEYRNCFIRYEIKKKAVLSLANTEKSFLRIPTLKEKMKAKDKEEVRIRVADTKEADDASLSFEYISNERDGIVTDDMGTVLLSSFLSNQMAKEPSPCHH